MPSRLATRRYTPGAPKGPEGALTGAETRFLIRRGPLGPARIWSIRPIGTRPSNSRLGLPSPLVEILPCSEETPELKTQPRRVAGDNWVGPGATLTASRLAPALWALRGRCPVPEAGASVTYEADPQYLEHARRDAIGEEHQPELPWDP